MTDIFTHRNIDIVMTYEVRAHNYLDRGVQDKATH